MKSLGASFACPGARTARRTSGTRPGSFPAYQRSSKRVGFRVVEREALRLVRSQSLNWAVSASVEAVVAQRWPDRADPEQDRRCATDRPGRGAPRLGASACGDAVLVSPKSERQIDSATCDATHQALIVLDTRRSYLLRDRRLERRRYCP